MSIKCYFCKQDITHDQEGFSSASYLCKLCGYVFLSEETDRDMKYRTFEPTDNERNIISISLRNKWEREGKKVPKKPLEIYDLEQMVLLYKPLDPIEKIDNALINFEKVSRHVGQQLSPNFDIDYPLYHCIDGREVRSICALTQKEGFTDAPDPEQNPFQQFRLTAKGYQRLREIQKVNKNSSQCFVAMWFGDEVQGVFEQAIRPAIEYIEPGMETPKYKAVKINNVEHINDINDEIIAQIRMSRFMVCDLTGYRGGVYFEAGFAYGLGLDVIYTCRKDWASAEPLKDADGNEIHSLKDNHGNVIKVQKEGIHFDLAHRNRIEWDPKKLEEFKTKLENRIKAVIY